MIKVAFQGESGAYSEEAAKKYFGERIDAVPCQTFADIFESISSGIDFGVVPIENSIEGNVTQTYDLILKFGFPIVGEVIHKISHCLIANEGANIKSIKNVYSHPQALGQCREYLERMGFSAIPEYDTAGSVKLIKEKGIADGAAIAGRGAAVIYRMKILASGIETNKKNFTRFFVISRKANKSSNDGVGFKTSVAFSTKHSPGALYNAIGCFANNGINLTYIQSRPILGKPWKYNFYLDCEGSIRETKLKEAVEELGAFSSFVKVLGSYQKAEKKGN
ncbi:prephenate dehydratase [Candidatus Marsarchaeota archaeon]|nr:prephenate dehydratase [Candidatus Marsarchaeota archaeon]